MSFLALIGAHLDGFGQRIHAWLNRRSPPVFLTVVVALALGISLLVLAPRLCILLREPLPGTFEWDRAQHFLAQARDPLHAEVEPALRWRLAPALLAHGLHLPGYTPLLVPWLGLIAALAYATVLAEKRLGNRWEATLLIVLLGTLGAVHSVTMAHGINDGWLLLAMLVTAFSSSIPARLGAAFIGPWVDERYLFALPLNAACRLLFPASDARRETWRTFGWECAGVLPYVGIRIAVTLVNHDPISGNFTQQALLLVPSYLPYAPLGWWMGQRAAWLLVALAFVAAWRQHGRVGLQWLILTVLAGFGSITLLAADLTRSTNFFFSLTCAGAFVAHQFTGSHRSRWIVCLVALNIALPFAMLTYVWIVPIHSLPFELLRLYKNP